jgi:hypothetical protein
VRKGGFIFHGYGKITDRAMAHILNEHYLRRKPPMQDTFEWQCGNRILAILTLGIPASRHMQVGACPSEPNLVVELNRLWVADDLPHGTASWFIAQCLNKVPPKIVLSYADTSAGHDGTVYRAANFHYAGWTDMDRKTARFDYIAPGKHSRDAFRSGYTKRVRRKPKARYWTVTGNKRERARLRSLCEWPIMNWKTEPVPNTHKQRRASTKEGNH